MSSDGASGTASGDRTSDVSVRELSELRDLLFGNERRQIEELRRRLDTNEISPEELAEKLPQAIVQRAARDRQLALALAPIVETAISESVRRNPHEIATAIFPVLGPSIRKAIAETMAGLVNTINRAIEHSLSPRGIRWRLESWRTGVPFAQIVIRHALVYRVEQVFLVHTKTGLLLAHVPEETGEDADLISGMLTAISDFVNDSFEPKQTGELRAFAAGDLTVLVEPGPQAYIAAVIRGQPPETLPYKLQTTLETIHLQWSNPLCAFEGDATPFTTTRPLLEDCIETVLATDRASAKGGFRRFAWVIPAMLVVGALAWWATSGGRRWNAAVARLEGEPGITVIRSERADGKWNVTGMRDPLAASPSMILAGMGVDTTDVLGRWEPYVSTEPALALERARRLLAPPGGVQLDLVGDTLVGRGRAPEAWIVRATTLAPAILGFAAIDLSGVEPGLPADMESLRGAIEAVRVLFAVGSDVIDSTARREIDAVAERVRALLTAAGRNRYDVTLEVVGRTDPSGSESGNLALSRRRAVAIRDLLATLGVSPALLEPSASGSANPLPASGPIDRARINRSVTFVVRARPSPGRNTPRGAERVR
ncbi:MAG TPA: OmpA family protein [Gemmatimonadaceae bacterium]|nr:OmpA family protein [Gemmatimonadaceae bacterium]